MSVLIIKLGATGDVFRTTPLLSRLDRPVSWIAAEQNLPLLEGIESIELKGDLTIASTAVLVWPMKRQAYDQELKNELESEGQR